MARKIAISGKIASGKTTLTSLLIEKYNYKQTFFATGIKEIAAVLTYDDSETYNVIKRVALNDVEKATVLTKIVFEDIYPGFKGHNLTFKDDKTREFLQTIGQSFRKVDPDIWVNYALSKVDNNDKVIIDDLRFKNEMAALKEAGFMTIRLNADESIRLQRIKELYGEIAPERLVDISEVDLDDATFDYIINSNLPLHDVEKEIKNIMDWNWANLELDN